jgi:hypothetical protein
MIAIADSRTRVLTTAAILLLTALIAGCSKPPPPRETVLGPGMSLLASNKAGAVRITYVDPITRRYEWDNSIRVIHLIPRVDRFSYEGQIGDGILGLYDPADTWFFSFRPRLVVQEAERHFATAKQAQQFLTQSRDFMDWVYTNDGLVVGFSKITGRGNQVNIDVWQLLINGSKPEMLEGAKPESIKILRKSAP